MQNTNAQDIYKWKDAEGKIHFGDRSKAPMVSKKVDIKVKEVSPTEIANQATQKLTTTTAAPKTTSDKKISAIDPNKINPKCKSIVDDIGKVPAGTPWQAQAKEFNQLCSGITWECNEFKRAPEKNHCGWVERKGSDIISNNIYQ